jgi:hypothetical protein
VVELIKGRSRETRNCAHYNARPSAMKAADTGISACLRLDLPVWTLALLRIG